MPASVHTTRIQLMQSRLQTANIYAIILNPGPSLYYLTGLTFHLMERPVVLYLLADSTPILVLPELEKAKLSGIPFTVHPFLYGEDPARWPETFSQVAQVARLPGKKVAVETTRLRFMETRYIEESAPGIQFVPGDQFLASMRMIKNDTEIELLRQSVKIAQAALTRTLPAIRSGINEKELAAELVSQTLSAGSDPELPFLPIVSFGPNTANPHASPSERRLQSGDLVLFDWGASHNGYFADLTRTFAFQSTDREFKNIAKAVHQANQAAIARIQPGIQAGDVDQAARLVIENSGYGKFFFHRTGHGIGLEAHEEPYIRSDNPLILQAGMVFTVEPGIYLPNRGGIRIEDNVVVTEAGVECLSDLQRDLILLG